MNNKKRLSTILIWMVIFIGGSYIIWQGGGRILKDWQAQLNKGIREQTEAFYMPGLAYMQKGEEQDLKEWIASKAMQSIIPLGNYVEGKSVYEGQVEDESTYEMIMAQQANDENEVDEQGNLINGDGQHAALEAGQGGGGIDTSIEKLRDFNYLLGNFYTVDSTTTIGPEQLNPDDLLNRSMKIAGKEKGPKVLIFHTHSQETFVDSVAGDPNTSIVGVGAYLADRLNERGIETIHHDGVYDLIDGKLDRSRAYEMSEIGIQKILEENPSIEIVIDLHRDGVNNDTHLVTDVNGKQTAKIMFFNGLSRTKTNGDIAYLANPYIQDNLAFSLQMQLAAENSYPGFARKIYLKGYRYSLHMKPKSLLIEAGAQTNTVEEMKNAMDVLADVLDRVVTE